MLRFFPGWQLICGDQLDLIEWWFSSRGNFTLPTRRDIWQCMDIFGCHNLGWQWHTVCTGQEHPTIGEHPIIHRKSTPQQLFIWFSVSMLRLRNPTVLLERVYFSTPSLPVLELVPYSRVYLISSILPFWGLNQVPEVLNGASLFHCGWARPAVSQHFTTCGVFLQDSSLSNWLVLLSLTLSKYSPVLGQSPEGHLRVELWASPPSQGTLPINSSLLSNPKFQTLCPVPNKTVTFCQSVQLLSHVQLFVTPWTASCQASLSITNSRSLLSAHDHRVGDGFQPSHPLPSPSPPAFSLSQHLGLFQWVSSSHHVAKVLELQLQHQSSQWIFRTDFL